MAKFHRLICPVCNQPLYPAIRPGKHGRKTVYLCGCPGLVRDIGGEDRDIESGAIGVGREEDDGVKEEDDADDDTPESKPQKKPTGPPRTRAPQDQMPWEKP